MLKMTLLFSATLIADFMLATLRSTNGHLFVTPSGMVGRRGAIDDAAQPAATHLPYGPGVLLKKRNAPLAYQPVLGGEVVFVGQANAVGHGYGALVRVRLQTPALV